MTEAEPRELPRYSIQLRDAYLYEATVARRDARPGDDPAPSLNAGTSLPELQPDSNLFTQLISVAVAVPFNDGKAVLELKCAYNGVFASALDAKLTRQEIDLIAERTTTVLLWPYLRAGIGELARMTGVDVPQIPTLDVVRFLTPTKAPRKVSSPSKKATARKLPAPKSRTK